MDLQEKREEIILMLADELRVTPFTFEIKVKENPKGIRIILEVTQECMNAAIQDAAKMKNQENN